MNILIVDDEALARSPVKSRVERSAQKRDGRGGWVAAVMPAMVVAAASAWA